MIDVVSVADHRFHRHARHLKQSLLSSNNQFHLTVYCDRKELFADLASDCCRVVEVPDMAQLGPKRAKITAFRHAIDRGAFLYLDADVIVLEPLDELCTGNVLTGCADDLSHCSFIQDKQHPWPNAPELRNNIYINSGMFFAPADTKPFFEELYRESCVDSVWNRYIFPGGLYDNHFLCAFLNLTRQPVRLVDEQRFDWQGFFFDSELQVQRSGNHLVNKINGKILALVVFAGLEQSLDFLLSLPPDVSSLLFERIMPSIEGEGDGEGLARCLAEASPHLAAVEDLHALVVMRHVISELRHLLKQAQTRGFNGAASYFHDPDAMRAFSYAKPYHSYEWNGLKCGAAYLDGDEYNSLRDIVRTLDIRSVVETGAGESSILFSRLGVQAVSVESQPGPWLDRACAHGCNVLAVPFNASEGRFAEDELRSGLQRLHLTGADLLFIDSPVGTASRRCLLSQFMEILPFRYVAYHDAYRDAVNIFRDQSAFQLRPVFFTNSARGLIVFEVGPAQETLCSQPPTDAIVDPTMVALNVEQRELLVCTANQEFSVTVEARNLGTTRMSSHLASPVFASYHWLDHADRIAEFDGLRTALPCDLYAGDSCRFRMKVVAPPDPGRFELQITLVQELVCWFHDLNPDCLVRVPVEVRNSETAADQAVVS